MLISLFPCRAPVPRATFHPNGRTRPPDTSPPQVGFINRLYSGNILPFCLPGTDLAQHTDGFHSAHQTAYYRLSATNGGGLVVLDY